MKPDGVFLSNGPGDPGGRRPTRIETIQELLGKKPIFGICLGHQLLALALGAKTYKLKFGHRGAEPAGEGSRRPGAIEITTQNHGFAVDVDSLEGRRADDARAPERRHERGPRSPGLQRVFSVQYHPEAAAGPHDALYLFERFTSLMDRSQ